MRSYFFSAFLWILTPSPGMPVDQAPRDLSLPTTEATTAEAPVARAENEEPDPDSCCNGTAPRNSLYCYSSPTNSAQANYNGCHGTGGYCYNGVLEGGANVYCAHCTCVA
jgi:hypothetical protein